jgi:hypothetical protein
MSLTATPIPSDLADYYVATEYPIVACPTCIDSGMRGWLMTNPSWPAGEGECYTRCPDCGGNKSLPVNELGGEAWEKAMQPIREARRAAREAKRAREIEKLVRDEQRPVPCPACKDSGLPGRVVVNPDWPSGDGPHYEPCGDCGGSCEVARNELP